MKVKTIYIANDSTEYDQESKALQRDDDLIMAKKIRGKFISTVDDGEIVLVLEAIRELGYSMEKM